MKVPLIICLINCSLAILLALLFASTEGTSLSNFSIWFGMVALGGGAIDVIIGLLLLFKEDKKYAQGFLLSGGILIITGFAACTL